MTRLEWIRQATACRFYPDQKTFEAAMQSSENRAVADDLTSFAKGKVKLLVAESEDK
jgi:hypothetical protein